MTLCGTNSGYATHYRHKEPVCGPCRKAHSDYAKAWWRGDIVPTRSSAFIADYLETHGPMTINCLIDLIQHRHDFKDATIRRAVWRMVNDGRLIVEYDPVFPLTVEVP